MKKSSFRASQHRPMYTFTITKDKKNEIKHLLTHIPDPAKDTLVSKFKKTEVDSSSLTDYISSM